MMIKNLVHNQASNQAKIGETLITKSDPSIHQEVLSSRVPDSESSTVRSGV